MLRSSITLVSRIVSKLAIIVFLVIAARLLSTREFGVYSYVLILAQTFGILADPQVALVAGRNVAAGRQDVRTAYWSVLPIVVASGLLAALAMVAFGELAPAEGATLGVLAVGGAFVVCNRLSELGATMLRSTGRLELEAVIQTLGTVVLVAAATAIASAGHGIAMVLAAFCLHSLVSAGVCWWAMRDEIGPPCWITEGRRALLRTGIRLSVAASAAAAATRAPIIVLGVAGTATQVAALSAALRFSDAAYLLALTAGQALLPGIASLAGTDPGRARRLALRLVAMAFVGGALLGAVLAPFGSTFTAGVFGDRYEDAGTLFTITMVSLPFTGMLWISWFSLFALHREDAVARATVAAAALGVLAALVAIPLGGATAAAWVYAGSVAVLGCGMLWLLARPSPDPGTPA